MTKNMQKKPYEKPSLVKYGSVYGMTRSHKFFGPGDAIVLTDDDGNVIGIHDAPSAFH